MTASQVNDDLFLYPILDTSKSRNSLIILSSAPARTSEEDPLRPCSYMDSAQGVWNEPQCPKSCTRYAPRASSASADEIPSLTGAATHSAEGSNRVRQYASGHRNEGGCGISFGSFARLTANTPFIKYAYTACVCSLSSSLRKGTAWPDTTRRLHSRVIMLLDHIAVLTSAIRSSQTWCVQLSSAPSLSVNRTS